MDAYAVADAVLAGRARALPKSMDGIIETIRAVHVARSGAIKARTACINELRSLLITAPARLREQLASRSAHALTGACTRLRPGSDLADPLHGTKLALRSLARRYQALTHEITDLDTHLKDLIAQARPDLLTIIGVGPETAAQLLITCGDNPDRLTSADAFATLCGAAPVPASSGKTNRHRLCRGGDRQANRALYLIVLSRMAWCPRTKAYITRRTTEGKTKKEIIRCLKRHTARELFKALTQTNTPTPCTTRHQLTSIGASVRLTQWLVQVREVLTCRGYGRRVCQRTNRAASIRMHQCFRSAKPCSARTRSEFSRALARFWAAVSFLPRVAPCCDPGQRPALVVSAVRERPSPARPSAAPVGPRSAGTWIRPASWTPAPPGHRTARRVLTGTPLSVSRAAAAPPSLATLPARIKSAASSRTCSRLVRAVAVSPPPSGYLLIHSLYWENTSV